MGIYLTLPAVGPMFAATNTSRPGEVAWALANVIVATGVALPEPIVEFADTAPIEV